MYKDCYEESSPVMLSKEFDRNRNFAPHQTPLPSLNTQGNRSSSSVTKPLDSDGELKELNRLVEMMNFARSEFRQEEHIYKDRIRNDIINLDVLDSGDVKSGFKYLYSRYEKLGDCFWIINGYVQKGLSCIKKLKHHRKDLSSALSKPFNVLSEYLYLKENFEDHQKIRHQQLEKIVLSLDGIENTGKLRDCYDFLGERYVEFQEYSKIQEKKLQYCKDLMDEVLSFEEGEQKEEAEIDENYDEYFERPFSESSMSIEIENEGSEYDQDGFYSDRSANEEQNESLMPEEASSSSSPLPGSPSAVYQHQSNRMPRPPPPRRDVVPEDIKKKKLPPIPGHVFTKSKVNILQEKLPNFYNGVGSTGYGKNTRRAPLYVRKPSIVLPPLQNTQYQQFSSSETSHQYFPQYDESLAIKRSTIKGIVKPNLTRKDLMNLRDPTVRPRAPKQTAFIGQEVLVRGSIRREQKLVLPRIPQPPPKVNNNRIPASMGSQIPTLPAIQQNQGVSGILRPYPPPQPPMMSRPRTKASHRRYVASETGLPFPFPRRQ